MNDRTITDMYNRPIGVIRKSSTGEIAEAWGGLRLGYYDSRTDTTTDASGKPIGYDNLCEALIYSNNR